MSAAVGIDDLNVYASTLSVEFAELAAARGLPAGELDALRFARRSVVPGFEDPVTLAANAALPIVRDAGADAFGLLVVGTETAVDYAKPLSAYLHRQLGLPTYCRNFETKHACYGGTAALQMAAAWSASPAAAGRKALVIMSDVSGRRPAEYVRAEMSSGAGAVALSVSAEPRVLALEPMSGCAAREVFDVVRPGPTVEVGDALRSLSSYLDLLELAWDEYRRATGPVAFAAHFQHMVFHTPLVWLVQQAHRLLLESDGTLRDDAEAAASFARMVEPSLRFTRELGNIYSANLYAGLAALLDGGDDAPAPGARVGMFSYGSGACSELFGGIVVDGARERVAARGIGERLAARRSVTVADYDAAELEVERGLTQPAFEPSRAEPPGHFASAYDGRGLLVLERIANHDRRYRWS